MSARSSTRTIHTAVRRLLLTALCLQGLVAGVITVTDIPTRWRRRKASFPHPGPRKATIGDDHVTVYSHGAALYDDMLADIAAAQKHIYFESFIWKGDDTGRKFKSALTDAAVRGVQVFVVYDRFANLVVPSDFKRFPDTLQVMAYRVLPPWNQALDPRAYGRDHRKLLTVDGEVAFMGGYNVGSPYRAHWRDTHVRIEGPSCWDLERTFVSLWNARRGPEHKHLAETGTRNWGARVRFHRNIPRKRIFPIRDLYLQAFERAQHHIYVTQAYFIPDRDLRYSLLSAARRGVDVRVLLPMTSNHSVMDWLGRRHYSQLLVGGVRLFQYEQTMLHAKTGTVDGRWTTIGTANIDRMSLLGNFELNAEFVDDQLARHMEEIFATDCGRAREIDLDAWQRRPRVARAGELLLAPLRPLL